MLQTLALAAVLSVAPAQELALTNARLTYGELGVTRSDPRFLPGDLFFVAFDMEGISITPEGKVSYSMGMEVTDGTGKPIFAQKPIDRDELLPLGGQKLPARAFLSLGLDLKAGSYICKVIVTDRASQKSQTLERKFEILPRDFGIVGLALSVDGGVNFPAPPIGLVGQNLFVNFALIGFGRDPQKKTDAVVEIRIRNSDGGPTLAHPIPIALPKETPEKDPQGRPIELVPFQLPLPLNRAGSYTVEIVATDNILKKKATIQFPLTVLPADGK